MVDQSFRYKSWGKTATRTFSGDIPEHFLLVSKILWREILKRTCIHYTRSFLKTNFYIYIRCSVKTWRRWREYNYVQNFQSLQCLQKQDTYTDGFFFLSLTFLIHCVIIPKNTIVNSKCNYHHILTNNVQSLSTSSTNVLSKGKHTFNQKSDATEPTLPEEN